MIAISIIVEIYALLQFDCDGINQDRLCYVKNAYFKNECNGELLFSFSGYNDSAKLVNRIGVQLIEK